MDTPQELADRLNAGLALLSKRDSSNQAIAQALADTSAQLSKQLSELPPELRQLVHTADSGFPASGSWVDEAIAKQDKEFTKLARASDMVASWHGPDGLQLERTFIIRGNIRGWAHRWRTADKGPAQIDTDKAFVEFATECLQMAGIAHGEAGNQADKQLEQIKRALDSNWRTLPPV